MKKRLLVLLLLMVQLSVFVMAQDKTAAKEAYKVALEKYKVLESPEEKVVLLEEYLKEYPSSSYTINMLYYASRILTKEIGNFDRAINLTKMVRGKTENKDTERQITIHLIRLLGETGRSEDLMTLEKEMSVAGDLDYIERLLLGRAAIECKLWSNAKSHLDAALAMSTKEAIYAEMPEQYSEIQKERSYKGRLETINTERGWVLVNLGRVDEGLKVFQQAEEQSNFYYVGAPKTRLNNYHAQTLMKRGDNKGAIEKLAPGAVLAHESEAQELLKKAYSALNGNDSGYEDFLWDLRMKLAKPIDDFTLENYQGDKVTLSSFRGKVVLLNFWYPTCPYCLVELPLLKEIYQKHRDKGFEIIAVDYKRDRQGALKFIQENQLPFLFLENGEGENNIISNIFGVQGFPTTYIIDRQGKIVFYHRGFMKGHEVNMEKEIIKLLGK